MNKRVDDYTALPGFERKTIPTFIKATDEKEGIVEHIVSVFGVRDLQDDRVVPGAFTKTIMERGGTIRTLDQHLTDSALRVVGKPKALREIGRSELPMEVLEKFPEATGGLLATTQYAMKTDNGRDMFHLVDGGFLPETSIGYDPITSEFIEEEIDGEKVTTRLLKEIRLWEYSNVIWGANPATTTTGTKDAQADDPATSTLSAKETAQAAFDEEDKAQMQNWFKSATQEEHAAMWRAYCASEGKHTLEIVDDGTETFSISPDSITQIERPPRFTDVAEKGLLDRFIQDVVDQDAGTGLKAGRVFSARNATRIRGHIDGIQQALSDLDDMLSAAMPSIDESEKDEQEKIAPAPDEQAATGNEPQAGPNDSSPTKEEELAEIDTLLATIQRELSEDERESQRMA